MRFWNRIKQNAKHLFGSGHKFIRTAKNVVHNTKHILHEVNKLGTSAVAGSFAFGQPEIGAALLPVAAAGKAVEFTLGGVEELGDRLFPNVRRNDRNVDGSHPEGNAFQRGLGRFVEGNLDDFTIDTSKINQAIEQISGATGRQEDVNKANQELVEEERRAQEEVRRRMP